MRGDSLHNAPHPLFPSHIVSVESNCLMMYLVRLNQQHLVTRGKHQICHWRINLNKILHLVLGIFDDERVYHAVLSTRHRRQTQVSPCQGISAIRQTKAQGRYCRSLFERPFVFPSRMYCHLQFGLLLTVSFTMQIARDRVYMACVLILRISKGICPK